MRLRWTTSATLWGRLSLRRTHPRMQLARSTVAHLQPWRYDFSPVHFPFDFINAHTRPHSHNYMGRLFTVKILQPLLDSSARPKWIRNRWRPVSGHSHDSPLPAIHTIWSHASKDSLDWSRAAKINCSTNHRWPAKNPKSTTTNKWCA